MSQSDEAVKAVHPDSPKHPRACRRCTFCRPIGPWGTYHCARTEMLDFQTAAPILDSCWHERTQPGGTCGESGQYFEARA